MPTREEIVEWLQEAGDFYFFAAPIDSLCETYEKKWKERATQIAAMRCETCDKQPWCVAYMVMGEDALGEGCFSHEQKPAG